MVTIGNSFLIRPSTTIIAESHNFQCTNVLIFNQGVQSLGVVIDDNVWIGENVTILDGDHVGKGSVIGAGGRRS
jgi:acetyltransferase-like isoleucine patch superfamily enzyme